MHETDLDLVSVYAYADRSHTQDRQVWRDFLGFVLPALVDLEEAEIHDFIEEGVTQSAEDLVASFASPVDGRSYIRHVSATLAEILNQPKELGLAAFLEGNLPTRLYTARLDKQDSGENKLVAYWLSQFQSIQDEGKLRALVEEWKKGFNALLGEEEEIDWEHTA